MISPASSSAPAPIAPDPAALSERALIARVQRVLRRRGQALQIARAGGLLAANHGRFAVIDVARGVLVASSGPRASAACERAFLVGLLAHGGE